MNPQKTVYFLLALIIIGLPLFWNTHSDNEFTVSKISFLNLVILAIVGTLFYSFSHFCPRVKICWQKFSPYFIIIFLYLIVITLATVFSDSVYVSFFGGRRQQGLMQFIFYLLFFFVVLLIIENRKTAIKLVYWAVLASAPVSIWGILEYFNLQPIKIPIYDVGVAATLGHPSFLGAYLVMLIPLTVGLIYTIKSHFYKAVLAAVALLHLAALVLTQTRAAWVAFVMSFLFAAVVIIIKTKKRALLLLLLAFFACLSVVIFYSGIFNKLFDYQSGSGALRIIWWEQAVRAIKQRPILGYGPEMQEDVLMPVQDVQQGIYSDFDTRLDRAHNEILDQALTCGIIGLLVFFSFVFLVFKNGLGYVFKSTGDSDDEKKKKVILLALLTGLVAYFIQGLFSFSISVLYIYFWLFTALAIVLAGKKEENMKVEDKNNEQTKIGSTVNRIVCFSGVILAVYLTWFLVARPAVADFYRQKLELVDVQGRFAQYEIQDLNNKIIHYGRFNAGEIFYRFHHVNLLIDLAGLEGNVEKKEGLYQKAQEELDLTFRLNPKDFHYYPKKGELLRQWAKIDPAKYTEMDQAFSQAVAMAPKFAPFYYFWGRGLKEAGDYQKANEKLYQALSLIPNPDSEGVGEGSKQYLIFFQSEVYRLLDEIEGLI